MAHSRTLPLVALDTRVDVQISGDAADAALAAALGAWPGALVSRRSPRVAETGSENVALTFTVDTEERIPDFLDSLSSRVTLAAIDARSGELLMLHAAGLADPKTGRVVACVAPSGTGKTTLSGAAAGQLLYVTDETVAVTGAGEVIRYPKPLSVKQRADAWGPKVQKRPETMGLSLAPEEGLKLGAIVLLSRQREEPEGEEPAPRLEEVELFEAMIALVPELSYLSRMTRPLHRIAETIAAVGGVQRVNYHSARTVIPLLADTLGAGPSRKGESTVRELLRDSALELSRWDTLLAAIEPASTPPAEHTPQHSLDDLLISPMRGQALIFSGSKVSLVSSVAAFVLRAASRGLSRKQIRDAALEMFGEAPGGIDSALEHTFTELQGSGLLAHQ